jgi:hypothetical protein
MNSAIFVTLGGKEPPMGSATFRAGGLFLLLGGFTLLVMPTPAQRTAGAEQAAPVTLSCVAQPANVFPGEPVNVVSNSNGLKVGRKPPVYTWSSTGGRIFGNGPEVRIETGGLAAGDYVVTGRLSTGRGAAQNAACTTAFRVTADVSPTVACSANPTKILPGGFATITTTAQSSVHRPLTYSYRASAGQITGTGVTATLAAADVSPGTITVRCNVVDDRGQASTSTVAVEVMTPSPPPLAPVPAARKLCSVSFERDHKRPVRVDNEGKACLDEIALQLTRDVDATLVIVGKHHASEVAQAAAERSLNVKQYMTAEKAIDPSRIQVRTGESTSRMVDDVLVPRGASWDPIGTTSFDPDQIVRHGEPYTSNRR